MRKWIIACLVGTIWLILGVVVWVVASPCSHPLDQETAAVITSPRDNDVLRGRIEIIGWADDPDFWRYELHFAHEQVEGNWVSVEGIVYHQPVINRRLGRWDTTLIPNGRYRLRLRVVRRDGNYQDVYANGLRVANGEPTETPTPWPISTTAVTPAPATRFPAVIIEQKMPKTPTPRPWGGAGPDPVRLSPNIDGAASAWFADVAVDSQGGVHVVWDGAMAPRGPSDPGTGFVFYTVRRDGKWLEPGDIALHLWTRTSRPSIAVDGADRLHLLFRDAPVYYMQALAADAWSVQAWGLRRQVSGSGNTYISDLAVDHEGVIHTVWSEWVPVELAQEEIFLQERSAYLADVFYRRSEDGGRTWGRTTNLSQTPNVGSGQVQIKADAVGGLHVAWIEGRDQHSGEGQPEAVWYLRSPDGGKTWSRAVTFREPNGDNSQVVVGLDSESGVLLAWRSLSFPRLHYTWSTDRGETWTVPHSVPEFYARRWGNPYDAYDMATDALGHIHLVAVGALERPARHVESPLGLYHLLWDGDRWSYPESIAWYPEPPESPEYPRLAVGQGRRLHVVWFVRPKGPFSQDDLQVWYGERALGLPEATPVPTWTPMAVPTSPMPALSPEPPLPTPAPQQDASARSLVENLYTEADELEMLGTAALAVLAVLVATGIARLSRRR